MAKRKYGYHSNRLSGLAKDIPENHITVTELSKKIGISASTLYHKLDRLKIKPITLHGVKILRPHEVEAIKKMKPINQKKQNFIVKFFRRIFK